MTTTTAAFGAAVASSQYSIYYVLGNPAWAPGFNVSNPRTWSPPYNVSQYGLIADATAVFDVSSGANSPWPGIHIADRGADGKPCAGPTSGVCWNFTFSATECAAVGGVIRRTPAKYDRAGFTGGIGFSMCCNLGGCVPQEGDPHRIKAQVGGYVTEKVPARFTGNVALDVEGWNPIATSDIFGSCNTVETGRSITTSYYMEQHLRNYSLALVRQSQPSLSAAQSIIVAQREFSTAAAGILVAALEAAKAARPLASWGYYGPVALCSIEGPCAPGLAEGSDELCGYDHPQAGAVLRAQAEAQRPIWMHSDAMFPSIYFQSVDPGSPQAAYECDDQHFQGPACRNISLAHARALQHSTVGHAVRASVGVVPTCTVPTCATHC